MIDLAKWQTDIRECSLPRISLSDYQFMLGVAYFL